MLNCSSRVFFWLEFTLNISKFKLFSLKLGPNLFFQPLSFNLPEMNTVKLRLFFS